MVRNEDVNDERAGKASATASRGEGSGTTATPSPERLDASCCEYVTGTGTRSTFRARRSEIVVPDMLLGMWKYAYVVP
jgi:hypothetical protein